MPSDRDVVIVASYPSAAQAALAVERLTQEGIVARVGEEATGTLLGGYGPGVASVKVLVMRGDAHEAAALLTEAEDEITPAPAAGASEPWRCPQCDVEVDEGLSVCWSCGATADGEQDPSFRPQVADPSFPADVFGPSGEDAEAGAAARSPGELTADQLAERAKWAAILGVILIPPLLHLISLFLLVGVWDEREDLTDDGRRAAVVALAVDVVAIGLVVLIAGLLLAG